MAIDLTLNYSSGEFLEPKKKTGNLGERFNLAELNNFNTPDLEQSPDSFLKPGETLEEWDETFRRPNAYGGLQRQPFAPKNKIRVAGVVYPNPNTGSIYFHPRENTFIVRLGHDTSPKHITERFRVTKYGTKAKAKAAAEAWRATQAKTWTPGQTGFDDMASTKFRKWLTNIVAKLKKGQVKKFDSLDDIVKKSKIKISSTHITKILQEPEFVGRVSTPMMEAQKVNSEKLFRNHILKISKAIPKGKTMLINMTKEAQSLGLGQDFRGSRVLKQLQAKGQAKNIVVSVAEIAKSKSNAGIIRLAEELRLNPDVMNWESPKQILRELAKNIYGDTSVKSLQAVVADGIRYGEYLMGIRNVEGLRLPSLNVRGDLLAFILDDVFKGARWSSNDAITSAMNAMRDMLVGDKPGTLGTDVDKIRKNIKGLYDFDHAMGLAATYERAPGYSELGQIIRRKLNQKTKKFKIDTPFSRLLGYAMGESKIGPGYMVHGKTYKTLPEAIAAFNKYSKNFQKIHNIDTPILRHEPGKKLNAKKYITHYDKLSPGAKKNINQLASKGIVIESKAKPISLLLQEYLNKNKNVKTTLSNKLNSGLPVDDILRMISSDLKVPLKAVGNVVGKVLKVAGPASFALDVIPFAQVEEMGLDPFSKAGFKTLGEGYANVPRLIEDLFHVASDEGTWKTFGSKKDEDRVWKGHAKFGQRQVLNDLRNTPIEVLLEKIDKLERGKGNLDVWDKVMVGINPASMVGMKERAGKSPEKIKRLKEDLIKQWNYARSLPADHPDLVGEEKVDIKETENILGTQIPMDNITRGYSKDKFNQEFATGGRVGFDDGSEPENKMSDEEILESIRKGVFELEQNWNTEKSIPGKVLDVADVSNWPYYAARMLRAGMSVAEISAKLPFVSIELLGKLATRPAFKLVDTEPGEISKTSEAEVGLKEKFTAGLDTSWITDKPQKKLEGQGLFTEAFKKLMPGKFAEKTGLTSLIESQEQAMQDKGMSKWPEIAGKNIEMGLDITLPFGYVAAANKFKSLKKLLTPLVKDKNVNKVIEKALTDQGMSRREFNTLIASGGIVAAIKALGLDSLFKGIRVTKDIKAAPIQMLKNTSTKMPVWFPKFIDEINKKMTYEGSGMYTFKGTDDFLPGFHIERIGDDYYITGKNDYGQEFQVTYESPKWEGDKDGSFYNKGEFKVDDAEPVHMDPDGNVDFDGVLREDIDEVLGGTTAMENVATKTTRKSLTKGEEKVIDAEMRAQSEYDIAKDEGYFDDVE